MVSRRSPRCRLRHSGRSPRQHPCPHACSMPRRLRRTAVVQRKGHPHHRCWRHRSRRPDRQRSKLRRLHRKSRTGHCYSWPRQDNRHRAFPRNRARLRYRSRDLHNSRCHRRAHHHSRRRHGRRRNRPRLPRRKWHTCQRCRLRPMRTNRRPSERPLAGRRPGRRSRPVLGFHSPFGKCLPQSLQYKSPQCTYYRRSTVRRRRRRWNTYRLRGRRHTPSPPGKRPGNRLGRPRRNSRTDRRRKHPACRRNYRLTRRSFCPRSNPRRRRCPPRNTLGPHRRTVDKCRACKSPLVDRRCRRSRPNRPRRRWFGGASDLPPGLRLRPQASRRRRRPLAQRHCLPIQRLLALKVHPGRPECREKFRGFP